MPASSKSTIPQTKEEMSELISESAESYASDLSSKVAKEKLRAEALAKENGEHNLDEKLYSEYHNVVDVIKETEQQTPDADASKVTSS